jgi:MoaA/NifB/PqqE/SkfB family radical SAM enzyme
MEVLDYIDNLIISLFAVKPEKYSELTQMAREMFEIAKKNILTANELKKKKGFDLTINCVVTKDSIKDVEDVMDFCFEHNINFAIAPAIIGFYAEKALDCEEYRHLIDKLIEYKKQGKPVFNSYNYLKIIRDFKEFKCHPLLTPHVYPDGSLFYPCQLLKKSVNLLEFGDYWKAVRAAREKFGPVPSCDNRCHMSCYTEPSIVAGNPINLIKMLF